MSALRFVLRRLAYGALITLGVSVLTFAMLELAPGEFFDDLKLDATVGTRHDRDAAPGAWADRDAAPVRYGQWLGAVVRGDFGLSLAHRAPVAPLLWERARNTLILTVPALLVAWLIALPLGLWTARHRGRLFDRLCSGRHLRAPRAAGSADRPADAAHRARERASSRPAACSRRAPTDGDLAAALRDLRAARRSCRCARSS